MAIQARTQDKPVSRLPGFLQPYRSFIGIFIGIGIALVAVITLITVDHSNLWFPLTSAIAFPSLAISPFIIMRLQIPTSLKVLLIAIIGLVVVPFLGLRDTDYLELAVQMAIFAALALGLNIVVGFAGLLDLGYVPFFALGSYTC